MDLRYTVVSPESVPLEFELASIGRRGVAFAVDAAIVLSLIWGVLAAGVDDVDATEWHSGIQLLALFVIQWGYFTLLEWRWYGQTPGKRLVKLRVVRTDGLPIGLSEAVVRNFLRTIDWPPFGYGLGCVVALVHPRCARLGDMAAGTIVISEAIPTRASASALDFGLAPHEREAIPAGVLLPRDVRLFIDRFAARAARLSLSRADQIAAPLATALCRQHGWSWPSGPARLLMLLHHDRRGRRGGDHG
jgi:uncharacterized RDD family membrane protein YckC